MKIHNITEGYSYMSDVDPQPEQSVVDKFAGVADSQRSYYIMKWAEEKGMKTDDAMFKAGYIKDGYIGAGAWNWRYVGMGESVQEDKGYTFDTDGPDLVITSPEGKTKVLKDFSYFDEDPSQAELKSFFYRGKSLRDESIEEAESNMIGEPDSYYDAEDRTEAYNDLQDILQGNFMDDYIKDGVCPECAGSGYMDGEETFTNDDGEEEESSECMGFGNYGCDEGEMTQNDDGLPNWAEIAKHDESQAEKANRGPAPSQEQIMKILPRLHDEYVKSGRYNAFELPSILRQMYPELGKRQASSYVADFFKTFEEDLDEVAGAKDCWDGYKKDGTQKGTGKNKGKRVNKCVKEGESTNMQDMFNDLRIDDNTYISDGNKELTPADISTGFWSLGYDRSGSCFEMTKTSKENAKNNITGYGEYTVADADITDFNGARYYYNDNMPDGGVLHIKSLEEDNKDVERIKELAGVEENTKDEQLPHCHLCKGKGCDDCDNTGEDDGYAYGTKGDTTVKEGDSGEAMVSKMLAKALGDENKWTEMSAPELYAELESSNSYMADMIRYLAKMLYDVKLEERAYIDVGVADTVKDQRGKEFQFDKSSKKFKSQDGEEADVKTKLGKDLMRIRKNQMKKTTPSYKTKKNQGHKVMASIEEAYGDSHEITLEDHEDFNDVFGVLGYSLCEQDTFEAEYQGRKVKLNKPMQGDVKKFKVYVKDPKTGNVKKVNFGHGGSSAKGKTMKIRKSNPKARKSFRARHNCDNPGPKTKARYWSCRKW